MNQIKKMKEEMRYAFTHGKNIEELSKSFNMPEETVRRFLREMNLLDKTLLLDQAKELRRQGLFQKEIAEKLGISQQTVSNWFKGDSEMEKLAERDENGNGGLAESAKEETSVPPPISENTESTEVPSQSVLAPFPPKFSRLMQEFFAFIRPYIEKNEEDLHAIEAENQRLTEENGKLRGKLDAIRGALSVEE